MTAAAEERREAAPATTVDRLVDGVYPAMALLAGLELDVFSAIDEGSTSAEEVAASVGADRPRMQLLLDALVAAGLLLKHRGRFSLTAEAADHLTRSSPWSRVGSHALLRTLWTASFGAALSVRDGRARHAHDYDGLTAEEAEALLRSMGIDASGLAAQALDVIDLRPGDRVVDVGGGAGGAARAFAGAAPGVQATVVELPNIAPATRRLLAEAGDETRVDVVEADARVAVPGTYDVAWLSFLTQTLDPVGAEAVIFNTARALESNGSLHLVNIVVEPTRVSPPRAALFNIPMLGLYDGGRVHSVADYERWLRSAGFGAIRWTSFNDMCRLVSARRR